MIQHSRKPAAAVLLATCLLGVTYVYSTTAESRTGDGPSLAQLEVAIANPDASAETWLVYAQRLQQAGRTAHAAAAYQRVLECDPFHRTANLQNAAVLAQLGDAGRLQAFMANLVGIDPRLAQDVFGRPELRRYLADDRFQALLAQARVQSVD